MCRFASLMVLAFCPIFPLQAVFLRVSIAEMNQRPEGTRLAEGDRGMFTDKNFDILEALEEFAQERDHTVLDLAFAWLLANSCVCVP